MQATKPSIALCARVPRPFPQCRRCLRNPDTHGVSRDELPFLEAVYPVTDSISGDCEHFEGEI
jgi:hypothetical protein